MITSLTNGRIKHAIQLREKRSLRNQEGLFVAEGFKMFEEAPLQMIKEIYCREDIWQQMEESFDKTPFDKFGQLFQKIQQCVDAGVVVEQVSKEVFRKLSDTQTPQGIFFVMKQMEYLLPELLGTHREKRAKDIPLFLILEDVQDPGNLGTMIRTAEGAGATAVLMSKETVDIYNPKTIRATMGSLYRVPFLYIEHLADAIALLKQSGIAVYAAHLKGQKSYREISYRSGSAFLIGNEGNGLREETAALADEYILIPMKGKLESLNAAVAAALLMYEAQMQKG